jgi:hypothetical protein
MQFWSFVLVLGLTVPAILLLVLDALWHARARWRRRRHAQGGAYGVVVDARGSVIGTYVDPFQEPHRVSRVHGPGSVWTGEDPSDPAGWAWEGRAATHEEALHIANRLRYLHTTLLPELRLVMEREDGPEESTGWPPRA